MYAIANRKSPVKGCTSANLVYSAKNKKGDKMYNRTSAFPSVKINAHYFNENTVLITTMIYDPSGNGPISEDRKYLDLTSAKLLLKSLEKTINFMENK